MYLPILNDLQLLIVNILAYTFSMSTRRKWTDDEKCAIYEELGDLEKLTKLPSLKECSDVINKYKILERTPQQIKTWVDNQRRAESRRKLYNSKKRNSP